MTSAKPASNGRNTTATQLRARNHRVIFSIRWIVSIAAILLTAIIVISVNGVAERNARQALEREVEGRLLVETRNLALTASDALLDDFPELTLHPYLKELKQENPAVSFALVLDRDGVIQGDPDARQLGTRYVASPTLERLESHSTLAYGESLNGDRTVMVASVSVTHRNGQFLGTALIAIERSYLGALLSAARRQQTIVMIVFLVIGIIVAFMLMSTLLKPMKTLRQGIERIGGGDLDTPVRLRDRTEFGLLADAVNDMASELKHAQAEMVERERLAHEVDLARQIQHSLLPSDRLECGAYVIEGSQRAAAEVGGDYYDFFPLPDNRIGIAVADVSGKGLGGCLVMSMLHALLRALRTAHEKPSELLAALDEQLGETLQQGTFITMFMGVLEVDTGVLTHASAGHSPTMVFRGRTGEVEQLRSSGIPLGAIRGGAIRSTLKDATVTLDPGDALIQYTDGINEAFNISGTEQFGLDRMVNIVKSAAPNGSSKIIDSLHRSVKDWAGDQPPLDDETVLVVSRDASDATSTAVSATQPGARAGANVAAVGRDASRRIDSTLRPATLAGANLPAKSGEASEASKNVDTPPTPAPPADETVQAANRDTSEASSIVGATPKPEPLACLAEAKRAGRVLMLPIEMQHLHSIPDWLNGCSFEPTLNSTELELVRSALYEACANVIEHGYRGIPKGGFELWWVPGTERAASNDPLRFRELPDPPGPDDALRHGYFLILDQGKPFNADNWKRSDFSDPKIRMRGRGIGLDIIHGAMSHVAYFPGTPQGNITLLAFIPGDEQKEKHVA